MTENETKINLAGGSEGRVAIPKHLDKRIKTIATAREVTKTQVVAEAMLCYEFMARAGYPFSGKSEVVRFDPALARNLSISTSLPPPTDPQQTTATEAAPEYPETSDMTRIEELLNNPAIIRLLGHGLQQALLQKLLEETKTDDNSPRSNSHSA